MKEADWRAFVVPPGASEPTPGECAAACLANAEESARLEQSLERMRSDLPHGDPRIMGDSETQSIAYRIFLAQSDQRHWRSMAKWYRDGAAGNAPIAGKGDNEFDF